MQEGNIIKVAKAVCCLCLLFLLAFLWFTFELPNPFPRIKTHELLLLLIAFFIIYFQTSFSGKRQGERKLWPCLMKLPPACCLVGPHSWDPGNSSCFHPP